ncbi:MAG: phenylalanine--tRNA ligase subunit beta [Gammaproteobacteria bacterium]|nr:phenylalanine--tRNA ligase subunit beta [Gammaproteobacteria bacterium]MDH4314838.1 phenylalanine--tRNA ligase subunit beta [Gammaproteobacteria bacterium]
MKFPENWLREWVNPELDTAALAHQLTMAGHEVDEITVQGANLDGVVVAEVLSVIRHPDADRLSVCQVTYGEDAPVEVVCGAPNVRQGMKAAFAGPGTSLPNGMKLRRSKIRGVVSNGMLCSAIELGLGDESDGIIELPADAPTGKPLTKYLALPDAVLDINLTPNRGDCFSVAGIARDIAAMTGAKLVSPVLPAVPVTSDTSHPVRIGTPSACPRFAGRVVRNIDPSATSPLWMIERLRRAGLRAIHPVVDITNYVMLELGQPLHAYDFAKLNGAIEPRFAKAGEILVLLDEREIELHEETLVISDDSGPIGLAGIMGGLSTAVSDETQDVFFEAAFWPQDVISGRARHYSLHTDASMRFERGVDPGIQARAVDRATGLLLSIAGGAAGPLTDVRDENHLPGVRTIELRRSQLARLLGTEIPSEDVEKILDSLQIDVKSKSDGWSTRVPRYRFDLAIEHDLIEEIARIHGYDRIPEKTETAALPLSAVSEKHTDLERVADTLVARDYREVVTYSFVDSKTDRLVTGQLSELVLANPISSEMAVMRGSLWGGMLGSAAINLARQQERVRVFEIGKSFHGTLAEPVEILRVSGLAIGAVHGEQWGSKPRPVDFFDIKSDLMAVLHLTGSAQHFTFAAQEHAALQPGQSAGIWRDGALVGMIGKLHPAIAKELDIRKDAFLFELDADAAFAASIAIAGPISRFPSIRRDIAVVVKEEVLAAELQQAVAAAVPELIREVRVFDIYRGQGIEAGLKSVALGLILQETSRTLTDQDADSAMQQAVRKLEQEFGAELRD